MIIGFHLVWTSYGHWFPNDPRGSWSAEVWKPMLQVLGDVDEWRNRIKPSVVEEPTLQEFLGQAKVRLKWPVVTLTSAEIEVVGAAFAEVVAAVELRMWACAVMTNHIHVVIERHGLSFERIVNRLKGRSAERVRVSRGYPLAQDRAERVPIWANGYWVRYIDTAGRMEQVMGYVKRNVGEGREQKWEFVR